MPMGGFGGLSVHVGPTTGSQQFSTTPHQKARKRRQQEEDEASSFEHSEGFENMSRFSNSLTAARSAPLSLRSPAAQTSTPSFSPGASLPIRSPIFRKWAFEQDGTATDVINEFYSKNVTVADMSSKFLPELSPSPSPSPRAVARNLDTVEFLPEDAKALVERMEFLQLQQQALENEIALLESGRGDKDRVQVGLFLRDLRLCVKSIYCEGLEAPPSKPNSCL